MAAMLTASLAQAPVLKAQTSLRTKGAGSRRAAVSRVVCTAERKEAGPSFSTAAAAAALAVAVSMGTVQAASADISGLTPCAESKQFAKREKNELKNLSKRLKLYEADSAPALALKATMDRTEKRFATYAKQGLLCGADGLPHLISEPGYALRYGHAGEVFIPTFGFLYVAGYIGYVGRNYLNIVKGETKPRDKEIIIDVPLALRLSAQGAAWPLQAINELRKGTLVQDDSKITVSPR